MQGDTDKVAIGEGTGGSRSAALGGSAVHLATEKIVAKAKAIAAHMLGADGERGRSSPTACSPRRAPTATLTIGEIAERIVEPAEPARRDGAGPDRRRHVQLRRSRISPTAAISASSRSTRRPARVEILRYSVVDDVGTVMNPLLLEGQICGGIAQGVGQVLMEDIRFDPAVGPAPDRLVHGLRDAARRRSVGDRLRKQPGADQDQPARRQGRGRSRQRSARCRRSRNALVDALSPLGIRDIEMPATPERLWRAIREARQ